MVAWVLDLACIGDFAAGRVSISVIAFSARTPISAQRVLAFRIGPTRGAVLSVSRNTLRTFIHIGARAFGFIGAILRFHVPVFASTREGAIRVDTNVRFEYRARRWLVFAFVYVVTFAFGDLNISSRADTGIRAGFVEALHPDFSSLFAAAVRFGRQAFVDIDAAFGSELVAGFTGTVKSDSRQVDAYLSLRTVVFWGSRIAVVDYTGCFNKKS